jgi:hypothetical protein
VLPSTTSLLLLLLLQVSTRLRELGNTIEAGERHRNAVLQQIAFNVEEWATKVSSMMVCRHGPWLILCA